MPTDEWRPTGWRTPMQKTLVIIFGPPAVGKMTVGRELSRRTGLPLFHNHLSIEAVLPVFDFGTPEFNRLVEDFRRHVFEEVARSAKPGLIFTFVYGFGMESEERFVASLQELFGRHGGRVVFAELAAALEARLERNRHPDRLDAKHSKRDVAASEERLLGWETQHVLNSEPDAPFPFEPHLRIDNTDLDPGEAAERILTVFGLERREAVDARPPA